MQALIYNGSAPVIYANLSESFLGIIHPVQQRLLPGIADKVN